MNRIKLILAGVAIIVCHGPLAQGAVTLTTDVSAPTVGPGDQAQLLVDATIPGGTTPGGGTYNSQAYTDNAGPPGQIFTTPPTSSFALSAISVKGAGDSGSVIGSATTTWAVRISEVSGINLTPLKTFTDIPTLAAGTPTDNWITFSFTGTDVATLDPATQYAFEIYTTGGWFGIDGTPDDASYSAGTAFNSAGPVRSFSDNTTGNLANHGYDRTFVIDLVAQGVAGDINNDGIADINDYNIIRNNLEKPVPQYMNGDLTGDSYVDLNDFRMWTLAAPPELVASLSVPEPATCGLIAAALTALASLRRRRSEM